MAKLAQQFRPPLTDTEAQAAMRSASVDAAILYLTAPQVRARYGGVSDMSLWRWLRDKRLHFPQPHRIGARRLWKVAELVAWERTRAPGPIQSAEHDGAGEPEAA